MDFYEENNFLPNGAKAKKLRAAFERYGLLEELLEEIVNEDTESTSSSKPKNTCGKNSIRTFSIKILKKPFGSWQKNLGAEGK